MNDCPGSEKICIYWGTFVVLIITGDSSVFISYHLQLRHGGYHTAIDNRVIVIVVLESDMIIDAVHDIFRIYSI